MNLDSPYFTIEQTYSWAAGAKPRMDRPAFLKELHDYLAAGKIAACGFPNGGGEPLEISKNAWLNYRPSFADGGCAVWISANPEPVIGMFFSDARARNIRRVGENLAGARQMAGFKPGDPAVKWTCLRFSRAEVERIWPSNIGAQPKPRGSLQIGIINKRCDEFGPECDKAAALGATVSALFIGLEAGLDVEAREQLWSEARMAVAKEAPRDLGAKGGRVTGAKKREKAQSYQAKWRPPAEQLLIDLRNTNPAFSQERLAEEASALWKVPNVKAPRTKQLVAFVSQLERNGSLPKKNGEKAPLNYSAKRFVWYLKRFAGYFFVATYASPLVSNASKRSQIETPRPILIRFHPSRKAAYAPAGRQGLKQVWRTNFPKNALDTSEPRRGPPLSAIRPPGALSLERCRSVGHLQNW